MFYENEVSLVGCLGADPDIRSFQDGGRIANLSLATTRRWKRRNSDEFQEETEWHRVVVSADALVGLIEKYTRKGSYIRVKGRLKTRKWQDQDGKDRYSTEVMVSGFDGKLGFLDRQNNGQASSAGNSSPASSSPDGGQGGGYRDEMDDDIPF